MQVKPKYVIEAARLIRRSIVRVESEDVSFDDDAADAMEIDELVNGSEAMQSHEMSTAAATSTAPKKFAIKFAEYQRIANMIVLHMLRSSESEG